MKEPYTEGVAIHGGPESCVTAREDRGEALTGTCAGRVMEPRKKETRAPTLLGEAEGKTETHVIASASAGPARSKSHGTHRSSLRENREIPSTPRSNGGRGRLEKASGRTTSTHVDGKSDGPVVATKPSNKGAAKAAAAEEVERSGLAKGKAWQTNTSRTQGRKIDASSGLLRLREAARRDKKARFTALLHHVTIESLRTSYLALKRDAAAGVDGVTWAQYQVNLEARLADLHDRVHRGAYRAKPGRRVTIVKADGGERHLAVTTLEDKVVQRSVAEVLGAIYEVDFKGFSYGFRPGRGQHDALDALSVGLTKKKVNWVLDADIRGFFDTIDHGWLMRFLGHRIGDRRVLRLIQKWLRVGVLVDGVKIVDQVGSPQGATISPLLANIYLHYVFDLWVAQWRQRHAHGDMIVVRYADDSAPRRRGEEAIMAA